MNLQASVKHEANEGDTVEDHLRGALQKHVAVMNHKKLTVELLFNMLTQVQCYGSLSPKSLHTIPCDMFYKPLSDFYKNGQLKPARDGPRMGLIMQLEVAATLEHLQQPGDPSAPDGPSSAPARVPGDVAARNLRLASEVQNLNSSSVALLAEVPAQEHADGFRTVSAGLSQRGKPASVNRGGRNLASALAAVTAQPAGGSAGGRAPAANARATADSGTLPAGGARPAPAAAERVARNGGGGRSAGPAFESGRPDMTESPSTAAAAGLSSANELYRSAPALATGASSGKAVRAVLPGGRLGRKASRVQAGACGESPANRGQDPQEAQLAPPLACGTVSTEQAAMRVEAGPATEGTGRPIAHEACAGPQAPRVAIPSHSSHQGQAQAASSPADLKAPADTSDAPPTGGHKVSQAAGGEPSAALVTKAKSVGRAIPRTDARGLKSGIKGSSAGQYSRTAAMSAPVLAGPGGTQGAAAVSTGQAQKKRKTDQTAEMPPARKQKEKEDQQGGQQHADIKTWSDFMVICNHIKPGRLTLEGASRIIKVSCLCHECKSVQHGPRTLKQFVTHAGRDPSQPFLALMNMVVDPAKAGAPKVPMSLLCWLRSFHWGEAGMVDPASVHSALPGQQGGLGGPPALAAGTRA